MTEMNSFGKRGAAPVLKQLAESTNSTEAMESVEILSTKQHNSSRIAVNGFPAATISRILFSPARSASAFLRSSMSVLVPNHLMIAPPSSLSGTARTRNQRYSPSKRRKRASASKGAPVVETSDHFAKKAS